MFVMLLVFPNRGGTTNRVLSSIKELRNQNTHKACSRQAGRPAEIAGALWLRMSNMQNKLSTESEFPQDSLVLIPPPPGLEVQAHDPVAQECPWSEDHHD